MKLIDRIRSERKDILLSHLELGSKKKDRSGTSTSFLVVGRRDRREEIEIGGKKRLRRNERRG
jgi:hypothetical protein